ncbi:MAG TPA: serine/threonine-protein kinase, partial [Planctomycetaceae bacterium]|nr:serine/threonine-protein kinase [Planctomycetaceae bacterium]
MSDHRSPLESTVLERPPHVPAGPPATLDDTLPQTPQEVARALELSRCDVQPPARVPGFTVLKCLGEGAYGSVWLAREENTGKRVAIKYYTHRGGLDWSLLNREVEKLAVLSTSRNIVRLLEVGWDADPPHYVMEYLDNGSLAALLAEGPIPAHEAVRIAKAVLRALVHAHGSGILHCDLKPANVLLDSHFEPRICDFGQSRLSHEQNPALGTLFYMAPEQADLHAVPDARWDVYALGAILYRMLCGHPPHRTPEAEQRIRAAETLEGRLAAYRRTLERAAKPTAHRQVSGVDRRLADIVDRCLDVNPTRR